MKKYVRRAEEIFCGSCASDARVEQYLLRGAVKKSCGTFMRKERA